MNGFDSMDFQPNSVGVRVVRVIRVKDIARTLGCDEEAALEVVREIQGATSADGHRAFVLPSQLAAWAYRQAGKPISAMRSKPGVVDGAAGDRESLRRAASLNVAEVRPSGSSSLKEIRSDLRRLKSATVQPGAIAITIAQTAARLGCAKTKVFELLKAGELKRGKHVGRQTMVLLSSVDAFASGGTPPRAPTKRKEPPAPETAAEILRKLRQQR